MSETPQNPGTNPSPEPGQTPEPDNVAQSGTPAATGEPVAGGVPPQGAPDAAGAPPQQPYGGQPPHPGQPYGAQPGQPGTPLPGQPPYAGQPPYPGPPPGYAPPLRPDEERMWALLAHLGGIVLCVIAGLVVWLVFKDRSRFVDAEAKEALNFQITVLIATIAAMILWVVTLSVLWFLPFLVSTAALIFMILAAVESSKGRPYRYPVTLRLVQ